MIRKTKNDSYRLPICPPANQPTCPGSLRLTLYSYFIIFIAGIYGITGFPFAEFQGQNQPDFIAWAQIEQASETEPVVIEEADYLKATGVDETFDLVGHVRLRHGETVLTSDRVLYHRLDGVVTLDGQVRITRENSTLLADHATYYEKNQYAFGTGGVRLDDLSEGTTLTGEQAKYHHKPRWAIVTGRPRMKRQIGENEVVITGQRLEYYFAEADTLVQAIAQDSVTVTDYNEGVTITCQRTEYFRTREWAHFSGDPRLVKKESDAEYDIIVTGKEMTYDFNKKTAIVYDSVRIVRGPLQGLCDTIRYDSARQQIHMISNPVIWDANSEIRGDDILLELEDNKVSQATITGRAIGAYAPNDSADVKRSSIEGRKMLVAFDGASVRTITAFQNATSTYHPSESAGGPPGSNVVRAKQITIELDHGKLLNISAEGSVEGTYRALLRQ